MQMPGRGRFNKALNISRANSARKLFSQTNLIYSSEKEVLSIHLVSFSGKSTFGDQMLSILSFLKNVGTPRHWFIFSDGTYDWNDKKKLSIFPFVEIIDNTDTPVKNEILNNLTWMEKKFYFFSSVSVSCTTIFLDSDILFFAGFKKNIINAINTKNWYLSDLAAHFDPGFLEKSMKNYCWMNYTNSGFFILNDNIDWEKGKKYLDELKSTNKNLGHFSEQTAMEIVFKANSLQFLDPRLFCISMDDHFTLNTRICHNELAIRHFVGPIRYRMWLIAKKNNFFR